MSFREDARELFGLNAAEAAHLHSVLREEGFERGDSLLSDEWGPLAVEYLEDVSDDIESYMDYDESMWDDSFEWGQDDWIEAGEEYEITIEYEEK